MFVSMHVVGITIKLDQIVSSAMPVARVV